MNFSPKIFDLIRKHRPGIIVGMLLGLGVGVVAGSASTGGQNLMADKATREAVAAVKHAIVAGHKARDRDALDRLYAEDFTAIDSEEIRTKADLLEGLATDPEIVNGGYKLSAVRRWGDVAVAKGHGRMVIRSSDGSTREFEYDSLNVFEYRDGRWVYSAAFLP